MTKETVLGLGIVLPESMPTADRDHFERFRSIRSGQPTVADLDITYPMDSAIFPPEMVAPRFAWHNPGLKAAIWLIKFALDSSAEILVLKPSQGPPPLNIDSTAIPQSGRLPNSPPPTTETWQPAEALWHVIKSHTMERFTTVRISGFSGEKKPRHLFSGHFCLKTSRDSVGAPIFYRDVPFMPVVNDEKGAVLPLDNFNMKHIKWRKRDISRRESRVVLDNMPTCANCHSFSQDGQWLGMDIDGTQGDKGAYGIQRLSRNIVFERENIVSWNYDLEEKQSVMPTFGFLSSMSPDGQYAVSTVEEELFVVGYIDQAFLQVFYPTRGILAFWCRSMGRIKSLPGANNRKYVHCSPTWTPDGKTIIFSRATSKTPFSKNQKMPARANDAEETQIQYDLYEIPFNNGRGGKALPVKGASFNGMSNSFARVSPDGKWIVWVQCRNGLLMRPDSKLWIMPAEGGKPRLMNCNTWRMNSWHSWSPNSRWLVFSSKKNTIYTQMFLTHIDEAGRDSPPILIPNATADNRAVNLPEFFNNRYENLGRIEVPAISHFRYRLKAMEYLRGKFPQKALEALKLGLKEEKRDRMMRAEMMAMAGEILDNPLESVKMLKKSILEDPEFSASWFMLGSSLVKLGREREAVRALKKAIDIAPDNFLAMIQLAKVHLVSQDSSIRDAGKALHYALKANDITYYQKGYLLQNLARAYSENKRMQKAIETAKLGVQRAMEKKNRKRAAKIENELKGYLRGINFLSMIERK